MRISENSSSYLRLRDQTLWIAAVCFCAAVLIGAFGIVAHDYRSRFAGFGLFLCFGLLALRATDATFDKVRRTCDVRRLDVVRLERTRLTFREIVDVRLEIGPPQADASTTCRLSLVTPFAVLPLTAGFEPDLAGYNAMRRSILDVVFSDAVTDPSEAMTDRTTDAAAAVRIQREP
jgi:hypothetical protein